MVDKRTDDHRQYYDEMIKMHKWKEDDLYETTNEWSSLELYK